MAIGNPPFSSMFSGGVEPDQTSGTMPKAGMAASPRHNVLDPPVYWNLQLVLRGCFPLANGTNVVYST
jgi:hypothetical protein